jgi:filamentous hemagglutinin
MSAADREARENLVTSLVAGIAAAGGSNAATATGSAQIEAENNQAAMASPPSWLPGFIKLPGFKGETAGKGDGVIADPATELDPNIKSGVLVTPAGDPSLIERAVAPVADEVKKLVNAIITSFSGNPSSVPTNIGTITVDSKIAGQAAERGWTQQDIQAAINTGPTGTSTDKRSAAKAPDGIARDDTATVYGTSSGYIVVNDRTKEVVQVSDKTDMDWIVDSRTQWKSGK